MSRISSPPPALVHPDAALVVPARSSKARLLASLGKFAFLFFLVKGLLWLIVPALLAYWAHG